VTWSSTCSAACPVAAADTASVQSRCRLLAVTFTASCLLIGGASVEQLSPAAPAASQHVIHRRPPGTCLCRGWLCATMLITEGMRIPIVEPLPGWLCFFAAVTVRKQRL
jgi:hypothetical protein